MIPVIVHEVLEYVFEYASSETSWIKIKKEIISHLHPKNRFYFSRQKKDINSGIMINTLNDLEKEIIEEWINMGGNRLMLDTDMFEFKKKTNS